VNKAATAITRHREDLGWSKRRLARTSGVSAPYIVQIENGTRPATARVVGALAEAMGLPRYKLLGEAGFIPEDRVTEAEEMATQAIYIESIAASAFGEIPEKRHEWLVGDYLYLLGYDPYGDGYTAGPGGNHADWRPLVPDAPTPFLTLAKENFSLRQAVRSEKTTTPNAIEGWNELTGSDQRLVQQLVNKLRSAADTD